MELVMCYKANVAKPEVAVRLEDLLAEFGAQTVERVCWGRVSLACEVCGFNNVFGLCSSFSLGARECVVA